MQPRQQPWCDGRVGVLGPSYLGFTAWACVGACEPGELHAAIPCISQAVVRPCVFAPGGAVALELLVLWFYLIELVALVRAPLKWLANVAACVRTRRLAKACMVAPLAELDRHLLGGLRLLYGTPPSVTNALFVVGHHIPEHRGKGGRELVKAAAKRGGIVTARLGRPERFARRAGGSGGGAQPIGLLQGDGATPLLEGS